MKNLKVILSISLLFTVTVMLCSTNSYAQHDHSTHGGNHASYDLQPPHGGELKKVGKYHIEMLANMMLKEDKLMFYLFRKNLKTITNEGITGTVSIEYNDGTTAEQALQAKGTDFFVAQLKNTGSFQCIVKFTVKGKTVSTVFTHRGLGHHATVRYSCPMHPDIESDSPGKCSICGMNLKKQ